MKRVLIFSTAYFPLVGGAEVAVRELTDRMPDFAFEMLTPMIRAGLPREERIGRVLVRRFGFGSPLDKLLFPFFGAAAAARLHRAAPYDMIWSIMASHAGFAAERFKAAHPDVPFLLTLQEGDPPEFIARKVRLVKGWFRDIFRRADALQAISRFLMKWGRDNGFAGALAEVIPNGVDVSRFMKAVAPEERARLRKEAGFSPDDFVVITASRLVEKNGVDLLVRALPLLPPHVKLYVAGAGELEESLKALASELKVAPRVVWGGLVDHAELADLLAMSDAFCRPSRSEGLGNAFIEAQAAGLPTIGTDVGGIPDVIEDGANGLLIAPESPEAVAAAIGRLMKEPGLVARLREGGKTSSAGFGWDGLSARMTDLFNKMLWKARR